MCGRYAVFTDEGNEKLKNIIDLLAKSQKSDPASMETSINIPLMKTGEIFPTDLVPVITLDHENRKRVNLFKWGFPNYMKAGAVIINARCETLHEKPTFRNLLSTGRCLVPASGFYEWNKAAGSKKEKYLIRASDSPLIYFAGLYGSFTDKSGIRSTRFVIITTDANAQVAQIHNRMPAIFTSRDAALWLTASPLSFDQILKPYEGLLIFTKVG